MHSDALTPSAAAAASVMEEELRATAWAVRTRVSGHNVSIGVQHPLSAPTSFNFHNDERDHSAFISRSLAHPEFETVASGPRSSPQASLIGHFRAAAATYSWDSPVLATVASILHSHGVLTDAEAEWLARSGPTRWGE